MKEPFWKYLDSLIQSAELVIDRPKDSPHPRYPLMVHPVNYGYLKGTLSGDGHELDVWRGSLTEEMLDAVVCTVDLLKKDVEVKLLLGCTDDEKVILCDFLGGSEFRAAVLLRR